MPKKLTEEARKKMYELFMQGKNAAELSEAFGIRYSTAIYYTKIFRFGFKRRIDYKNFLARRKGFKGSGEQYEIDARRAGWNSHGERISYYQLRQGFSSRWEFFKDYAIRTYGSMENYYAHVAKMHECKSHRDYIRMSNQMNKQKLENIILSSVIRARLGELGRTQKWLAQAVGKSYRTIKYYCFGAHSPKKDVLEKIFCALDICAEDACLAVGKAGGTYHA